MLKFNINRKGGNLMNKITSKFFASIAVLSLVLGSFGLTNAHASTTEVESFKPCVADFSDYEKQQSEIITSDSGNIVYEVKDLDRAAEELNIPLEQDGEQLVSLAYAYTAQEQEPPAIAPRALYLKITHTGEACGQELIRSSYYQGPSTAKMSISEGVTAQWSTNFEVDAQVVSSAVGFTVTKNFTVTDDYTIAVPAGKTYNIKAYPIYLVKNFEIWNDPIIGWDTLKGSGYASKPIGVCFAVYK